MRPRGIQTLTLRYDKVLFILEPTDVARRLAGEKIIVCGYPDGRIEVMHDGITLPYRTLRQTALSGSAAVRLPSIPLPNGNGRFSRLVGDLLARQLGRSPCWGRANLVNAGETRARYVIALRAADNHKIDPLLVFARS